MLLIQKALHISPSTEMQPLIAGHIKKNSDSYSLNRTLLSSCGNLRRDRNRLKPSASRDGNTCEIAESVTFMPFRGDLQEQEISEAVDKCWSLQYMVRGPICASAGPVVTSIVPNIDGGSGIPMEKMNHCIQFRYSNRETMEKFLDDFRAKNMIRDISEKMTDVGFVTCTFSTRVRNELESIFRRGTEWEEGFELFLGMNKSQDCVEDSDVDEFLTLTQELASSSAFGAVQCVSGPVIEIKAHEEKAQTIANSLDCDLILMARFGSDQQVEGFLQSPPLQAVLQRDERSPVHAHWGFVMEISPSKSNQDNIN